MRKRVISTLLAMATTAGLFAGNVSAVYAEGKSSGDYEYQELEDAEITYYNYSVEGKELYEKEIAAYNEVHPNVKINLELVGGGTDWRSTLKAEISSGQAPDLVVMEGASDFDTFGDMIEDLSDQPWVEHIYENNVSDCKVGDAIVGAPSGVVCYGLLYNKAVFEACGIDGSTLKSYDDIDDEIMKIAIYDPNHQIIRYADDIACGLDKGVKATTSGNEWIDIQNEDINKGVAIKRLQRELNIKPEECMAFGDQMNDYTLLKSVKYSYAMANAVPRIKDIAYGIAKSNDHQGVLEVIKQEVLNEL